MTICPIAIVATCGKCPVVSICPLKSVLGDYVPPPEVPKKGSARKTGPAKKAAPRSGRK